MACILFVDDDPLTLDLLKRSCQVLGHRVVLASTGAQAIECATKDQPDLIFADMRLQDIDGLSLVRTLKQQAQTDHIPVVMLSASPEVDAAELARQAGAVDFLAKPVRLQTLQEMILLYATAKTNDQGKTAE